MRHSMTTLITLLATAVVTVSSALPATAQTKVYITRDADGNPVFSDRKSAGSETHVVQDLPSMPAFNVPEPERPSEESSDEPVTPVYTSLSIISPADGTTLPIGVNGDVRISGVLTPALQKKDSIVLLDAGIEIARGSQTSFQLDNLDRGEHRLHMEVRGPDGEVRITSQSIILHVKRASSLAR